MHASTSLDPSSNNTLESGDIKVVGGNVPTTQPTTLRFIGG
jgi:hypothetical protein